MHTLAMGQRSEGDNYYDVQLPPKQGQQAQLPSAKKLAGATDPRKGLIDATRKSNVGFNLFQILNKYIKVDQFLQGITDIVRRVNSSELGQGRAKSPQHHLVKSPSSPKGAIAPDQQDDDRQSLVYEKQMRMNARSPTKSGVISSPDPREQAVIQGQSGSPVFERQHDLAF